MYSGELEVQAKRKAIAVLQDEINRILNAGRSLSTLPELIVKKDKNEIKKLESKIQIIEESIFANISKVWGIDDDKINPLRLSIDIQSKRG